MSLRDRSPRAAEIALACAAGLVAACASADARIEHDAHALADEVHELIGVEPSGGEDEAAPAPSGELDEETAVRTALRRNPRVRAELAALGVSSARLVAASRLPNPILSANAKFFDSGTEIELGLAQPLLDLLFLERRGKIADAEHAREQARIASTLVALAHDVRKALVDLRAARAELLLRDEAHWARDASARLARALHDAGNLTDQALALEDEALGRADVASARARLAVLEARERLVVLLGLSADDGAWTADTPLAPASLDTVDPADVVSRSLIASLDLRAARAAARVEGERAGVVRWNAIVPGLDAGIAAKHETGGDWGLGPAIDLGIPIFDAGGPADAESSQRLRRELALAAALEIEIRSAARTLAARVNALRERESFERTELLARAQRVVETTLQRFNAMQIGAFDVLRAKEAEIESRSAHLATLRDLERARIELDELLRGRLDRTALAMGPDPAGRTE